MSAKVATRTKADPVKTLGIGVEYFPRYINRRPRLHSLPVVLLSFILRGHGRHIIDADEFEERGASLAVTHYGQAHDIITDEAGMDIINVYLDLQHHPLPVLPQPLQGVLAQLLPLHPRFVHRQNRIVRLQFDDPQPLADLLFAIERELRAQPVGYEEMARLYFKAFLIHCCRYARKKGFVGVASPSHLEKLRQYLDHAYAQPQTLASLAARARLTPTSLCRAFKTYTGKRVFDYLIERRVQAAMIRLHSGSEKVVTIALECGFNDLAHFNRKFKQLVGQTPTQYRHGAPPRAV
jgi:AraC-like DNA-binding protein